MSILHNINSKKLNSLNLMVCIIFFLLITVTQSYGASHNKVKKVLFIIEGGSHIDPTFELARKLINKGVEVTYITADIRKNDVINKIGADVIYINAKLAEVVKNPTLSQKEYIKYGILYNMIRQKGGIDGPEIQNHYIMALFFNEFVNIVKSTSPDLIIYDAVLNPWGKYVGRFLNIPYMSSIPFEINKNNSAWKIKIYNFFTLPHNDKRVWAVKHLKNINPLLFNDLSQYNYLSFSEHGNILYDYPRFYGSSLEDNLKIKVYFAGYESIKRELSKEELRIIEQAKSLKQKGKKIIFVSMGTDSSKPELFFDIIAEAFGKNSGFDKDYVIVLHPGPKNSRDEKSGCVMHEKKAIQSRLREQGHSNIIIEDYYPLPEYFQYVDVFIGHGGKNSTMQAAKLGKNILLCPIRGDQPDIASKFKKEGLAKVVPQDINPLPFSTNFAEWESFYASDSREKFILWLRRSALEEFYKKDSLIFYDKDINYDNTIKLLQEYISGSR